MISNKFAGIMFITAASAFAVAGLLAEQIPFYGVTAVFLIVGGMLLRKRRKPS
ncbi:hypothetical protein [Pleionea sediminis]|uniref:hypothetical protein n=1 Tax=Pleionea sediminis TaxID=2569479 RepID=UPI0013DDB70D|nr:hypothetical protein [Pleionea sediminis]